MPDIFLSYASEDRERVRPLVERLEEQGWSVWWDREIPPGMSWPQVIEQALDDTKGMVVVWTEASVTSKWVLIEASKGEERGRFVPVAFDRVEPPLQFTLLQSADLVGWDGSGSHVQFRAVVAQLEKLLGVPSRIGHEPQVATAGSGVSDEGALAGRKAGEETARMPATAEPREEDLRQTSSESSSDQFTTGQARTRGAMAGAGAGALFSVVGMGVVAGWGGSDLLVAGVPSVMAGGVIGSLCANRRARIRSTLHGVAIGALFGPVAVFVQQVVTGVSSPGLPRGDELPGSVLYGMATGGLLGVLYRRWAERRLEKVETG